jgi:hypothetical protein
MAVPLGATNTCSPVCAVISRMVIGAAARAEIVQRRDVVAGLRRACVADLIAIVGVDEGQQRLGEQFDVPGASTKSQLS